MSSDESARAVNQRASPSKLRRAMLFLAKATSVEAVGKCPECGGNVAEFTKGQYLCTNYGGTHQHLSRYDLDGDIKWWHGRLPTTLGFVVAGTVALWAVVEKRLRGDSDGC